MEPSDNGIPSHPGVILKELYLEPHGWTQTYFAAHIGWPQPKLNEIIRGRRGVTPETALTFSDALGTSPELWLNLQCQYDLWLTRKTHVPIPFLEGDILAED